MATQRSSFDTSRASHVDARYSIFNDIGGNQNNHAAGDQYIHNTHTTNTYTTPAGVLESIEHLAGAAEGQTRRLGDFIDNTERRHGDREFRELLGRLDAVNYLDDLEKSLELKLDGTCQWVLCHDEIQNWIARAEGSGRGVWICGKPGSGKTIVSAALVDHVCKLSPAGASGRPSASAPSPTLFFFCDNKANDTDHTSATAMLRTLLVQMLEACDSDTDRRNKLVHAVGVALGTNRKLTFRQVAKAFKSAVEFFSSFRIMIDAINECQDKVQLMGFLIDVLDSCAGSRVLLTSRDESDIRRRVDCPGWKRIDVTGEQDQNAVDIERYVAYKLDNLGATMPQLRDNPDLTRRIRDRLLHSANGMFLYVRVMFDLIEPLKDSSVDDVEKALESLPSGIKDIKNMYVVYFRELAQRAADYHRHQDNHDFSDSLTLRALWWLVGAKRPLRLEEISMAIVLSTSDDKVEQKKMLTNSREVVSRLLGALVDIRRPKPDWIIGPPDGTNKTSGLVVTLVHSSVKEFLTTVPKSSGFTDEEPAVRFLVSTRRVNTWIATRCLTYLTLDGVFAKYMLHYREGHYYTALPLVQYSVEHWADHIIDSQSVGAKDLDLRMALAKFISSALTRVMASMRCMSVGLPKICADWGKRSRKTSALVDVELCLENTATAVRTLIAHLPDIMAGLSFTAANLPESFLPPPYAPYDLRRQYSGTEKILDRIVGDEKFELLKLVMPWYDTRGEDAYKTGAPRSVQLALLEVVRQFPVVRSSIHNTQTLLDAGTTLRNAALALSSVEAQQLATSSGDDAKNVVAAFFIAVRALDMLVALPCLPYVPVDTFDPDGVFKTAFSNPPIARHILADILRCPVIGSVRSTQQLEWRVGLYELIAKRQPSLLGSVAPSLTLVIFSAVISLGGLDMAFSYTTFALYRDTKRQPLYSFQANYTFNHYQLRERGRLRLAIAMYMANRIFRRLLSDGFRETVRWLVGAAGLTVGLSILHKWTSAGLIGPGKVVLCQALLILSNYISQPLATAIHVVVTTIIWWRGVYTGPRPVFLALCSLALASDTRLETLGKVSLLDAIESLWLADVLNTLYALVVDPAGIRDTLKNTSLVQHMEGTLALLKIMPIQLQSVHLREMLPMDLVPQFLDAERFMQRTVRTVNDRVTRVVVKRTSGITFLLLLFVLFGPLGIRLLWMKSVI